MLCEKYLEDINQLVMKRTAEEIMKVCSYRISVGKKHKNTNKGAFN